MATKNSITGLYCCGEPVTIGESNMNQNYVIIFQATCGRCKTGFEITVSPPPGSQGWWMFRGIRLGQYEFAVRQ